VCFRPLIQDKLNVLSKAGLSKDTLSDTVTDVLKVSCAFDICDGFRFYFILLINDGELLDRTACARLSNSPVTGSTPRLLE